MLNGLIGVAKLTGKVLRNTNKFIIMDKECKDSVCSDSGSSIIGMVVKIPLGDYVVKVCGKGVHSVSRVKDSAFKVDQSVNVMESNPVTAKIQQGDMDAQLMLQRIVQWFHLYFVNSTLFEKTFPKPFEICVPNATELQKEVWKTLQERVPFGSTVSYGGLANYVNRPRAARAIGSAMKNNPNCIIVPCHRVIKATSEIGNYNGGAEIKVWLLNHEKEMTSKNGVPAVSG